MKSTKRKLTGFLAIVTVLTMMAGVFAYFTDRVETAASATTAKASEIIKVTPDGTEDGSENPGKSLKDLWDKNNDIIPDGFIEPGDEINLSYELSNIGDSDIDVKETIVITVTDASGADLTLSLPEFRMFLASQVGEYGAIDGIEGALNAATVESIDGNQITYTLAGFTLEKGQKIARPYKLVMDKFTGNTFQGATCTVEYLVEMRQHVDSIGADEGWNSISLRSNTVTFGGKVTAVVPAA